MIVANAGILIARVIYAKRGRDKAFTIVDAAMNDLIRPTLYEAHHEIWPVEEKLARKERELRVYVAQIQGGLPVPTLVRPES